MKLVRIQNETQLAAVRDELGAAVLEYAIRSRDPSDPVAVMETVTKAIQAGVPDVALWAVLDDHLHLVAYCVTAVVTDPMLGSTYVTPVQLYVKPGAAQVEEIAEILWNAVVEYAKPLGAVRALFTMYRANDRYERKLGRMGFRPIARVYERVL